MKSYKISCEISGIGQVYNEDSNYDYEHGALSDAEYETMIDNFDTGTFKWDNIEDTNDKFCFRYIGKSSVVIEAETEAKAKEKAINIMKEADFGKLFDIQSEVIECREITKEVFHERG